MSHNFSDMLQAKVAMENAIENKKNRNFVEALSCARHAKELDESLRDIDKLVAMLEVLAAPPDIAPHELLGVEQTANENEIYMAFHKLSNKVHPYINKFSEAREAFNRISEATRVLLTAETKDHKNPAVLPNGLFHGFAKQVAGYGFAKQVAGYGFAKQVAGWVSTACPFFGKNTMADDDKYEATKFLDFGIENTKNGKYEEALKSANEASLMNSELPDINKPMAGNCFMMRSARRFLETAIEKKEMGEYMVALSYANRARLIDPTLPDIDKLVTMLQVLAAPSDIHISFDEFLDVERTANGNEIRMALLPTACPLFAKNTMADDDKDEATKALDFAIENTKNGKYEAGKSAMEGLMNSELPDINKPEKLLEANKDEATRALDIAIKKAIQEEYPGALKFATKAQQMDPELPKIGQLVASMKILSASSDTTHYKILGVEETDGVKKIKSAYRKLAGDVHPDHNKFPKSSEAFTKISLASKVLTVEESRADYDHDLATERNAAAREASASRDVGRGFKRKGASTLHTAKKRREGQGPSFT